MYVFCFFALFVTEFFKNKSFRNQGQCGALNCDRSPAPIMKDFNLNFFSSKFGKFRRILYFCSRICLFRL